MRLRFLTLFLPAIDPVLLRFFCLTCPPAYLPSMWISSFKNDVLVPGGDRLADLHQEHPQAVSYWHPSSRESWKALFPSTEFTDSHSAVRMSRKDIFRKAKTVFEVTESSRRHFLHLKHWRRIGYCSQRRECGQ